MTNLQPFKSHSTQGIRRDRQRRCLAWVLLGILLLCASRTAWTQVECPLTATYAGPPVRTVPEQLWNRDFRRSITGDLPQELQKVLHQTLDKILTHVPEASVAVALPGEGFWSATRGLSVSQPPTHVTANALFQAASITKTFTAVVVLQLVNESRLRLDDKIARWYPHVPNAEVMTIEHLLRHTDGLVSFNALPSLGEDYRPADEGIQLAAVEPPLFCPGTNWAYSNTGYAILARIVEKIEARPFHKVLASRLIAPLSLGSTVFRQPGVDAPVVGGHASGQPVQVRDGYATAYAAGAMASTASDLVHFWNALLAGDIVPPVTVQTMFSKMPAMTQDGQSSYGIGVQMYDVPNGPGLMLGHSGGIIGFTSVVAYVAADDIYVAVMFNDKEVPAEAGLWAIVRTVRAFRSSR